MSEPTKEELQARIAELQERLKGPKKGSLEFRGQLEPEDFRGITPLFYSRINPYGRFELDLSRPRS
jgi:hypothetical protein